MRLPCYEASDRSRSTGSYGSSTFRSSGFNPDGYELHSFYNGEEGLTLLKQVKNIPSRNTGDIDDRLGKYPTCRARNAGGSFLIS